MSTFKTHSPFTEVVTLPQWPTSLGIATFCVLSIGTIFLPLAVISVAYLINQITPPVIATTFGWVILCVLLGLNAVQAIIVPIFVYAVVFCCIGLSITIDGLLLHVYWRDRSAGTSWLFNFPTTTTTTTTDTPSTQRTTRRGLSEREIRELPIVVCRSGSELSVPLLGFQSCKRCAL